MSWFDRFRRRTPPVESHIPGPSSARIGELKAFMENRDGVEAFIEPPTSVYPMSLCLVAADGEYLRRPVKDAKQANGLASKHGVPIYDAPIVGYPRRMRDYDRGVRSAQISLDDLPPLETADDSNSPEPGDKD